MVKRGFSLAEALVVMLIISIFFAVAARVASSRVKPKTERNADGYYECYKNGSKFEQRIVSEGIELPSVTVTKCTFEPPVGAPYFTIYANGGGGYSAVEPNINSKVYITFNTKSLTFTNAISGKSYETPEGDIDNTNNFKHNYPNSAIYNNGNMRMGILIDW